MVVKQVRKLPKEGNLATPYSLPLNPPVQIQVKVKNSSPPPTVLPVISFRLRLRYFCFTGDFVIGFSVVFFL